MENNLPRNGEIDKAVLAIKTELGAVIKKVDNTFFKSKYADLEAHLDLVEPLLKKNGCYLTQPVIYDARSNQNVQVSKIVHAESGQSIESSLCLGEQPDMQKLGSAMTYARRYTLGCLLAIKAEDDDFESGMGRGKKPSKKSSNGDF